MHSYLSGRKQRVKLSNCITERQNILKCVPQRSILGSLIFNIFIYDIFYFLAKSSLYNYADDDNQIQANPGKFQAIAVGQKSAAIM